nr:MAG TPA: homing endonuclease [Caudoviricetes sp.]
MEQEVWKDIHGYEGLYQISNMGRVKSLSRVILRSNGFPQSFGERILSPRNSNGYRSVSLCCGTKKTFYVHRLVADAFIPNPNGYKEVNHKNEDKADNRAENIEWCSRGYNLLYGCRGDKAGHSLGHKTILIDGSGEELVFDRETFAAKFLGVTIQAISQAYRKNQKSKGYKVIIERNGTK